jgi:RNA polymerase sigma factor (TIGR02999 family)
LRNTSSLADADETATRHLPLDPLQAPIQYSSEVTNSVSSASGNDSADPRSASQLLVLLYEELRRLASQKLAKEGPRQTLQATALVHEAWLRLGGEHQPVWENRAHFFAAAAEAMRRILVDNARRKTALRRGGGAEPVSLEFLELASQADDQQLLAVHEALDRLAAHDAVKAELVKLRFFGGLKIEEAANALGVSEPTAKRYWSYARAWLYREIKSMQES